jgi:polysaccharide biosynthesis transport protein
MRGGRVKLPVLAEIAGPAPGDARAWSLRRTDMEALAGLLGRLGGRRTVLVTGPDRLAGTLAVSLASAAVAAGRRAALLECELARPRLAAEVGLATGPGLHEYLRWETTAPEILQSLALAGPASGAASDPLVCIAAGRPAAEPAGLLELASFQHAATKLRGAYDLVVFDGPGLASGHPALAAVAAQADALLVCLAPSQVSGRGGRAIRTALRGLPTAPLGAVVLKGA